MDPFSESSRTKKELNHKLFNHSRPQLPLAYKASSLLTLKITMHILSKPRNVLLHEIIWYSSIRRESRSLKY